MFNYKIETLEVLTEFKVKINYTSFITLNRVFTRASLLLFLIPSLNTKEHVLQAVSHLDLFWYYLNNMGAQKNVARKFF